MSTEEDRRWDAEQDRAWVCKRCGSDVNGCQCVVIHSRADLVADAIYVNPDGSAFRSPDGVGCYFYDSEEEAIDDSLESEPEVINLDEPFDQLLN